MPEVHPKVGFQCVGGSARALTPVECEAFECAARPLMAWIERNCHPHTWAIVEAGNTVLLEGVATAQPPADYKWRD